MDKIDFRTKRFVLSKMAQVSSAASMHDGRDDMIRHSEWTLATTSVNPGTVVLFKEECSAKREGAELELSRTITL
jgi:hypothetical protein